MKRFGVCALAVASCALPVWAAASYYQPVFNKVPDWAIEYPLPTTNVGSSADKSLIFENAGGPILRAASDISTEQPVKNSHADQNSIQECAVLCASGVRPARPAGLAYRKLQGKGRHFKHLSHWRPLVPPAAWKAV